MHRFVCWIVGSLLFVGFAIAQGPNATVTGRVLDPNGAMVAGAKIEITNSETGVKYSSATNGEGIYTVSSLQPGIYRIEVAKPGFKTLLKPDVVLHVQDIAAINFSLPLGSVSETVTVSSGGIQMNTTDASVSTVVDRQFVENMPLNGRSFQNLLTLTPGVVQVPSNGVGASGEISVNGQRTEGNYFTLDGVSVNTGVSVANNNIGGAGFSGGVPGETVLGTTQSIVSIDALQEFRASTSSYSAEYGRTPGGQFSFSTRSGANSWHGSLFDYFRNDVMDANNWFNECECLGLPVTARLPERQNDFGGTLGGPIRIPRLYNGKDKTFFFFSYEGLRLTVPQAVQPFSVPDLGLRNVVATSPLATVRQLAPFLNAFALPNGGEDGLNDGLAYFNLAYSSPSSLDNVGIRIDHNFGDKLKLFGRYANSPSSNWTYYVPAFRSNSVGNVRTLTVGATSSVTRMQANELRFNITQNNTNFNIKSTNFGGATPFNFNSLPRPNGQPATSLGSDAIFELNFGGAPAWQTSESTNSQRQFNVTDTYTWLLGRHQFKFGVDWRRLTTFVRPITSGQLAVFNSEASVLANSADLAEALSFTSVPVEPVYHNFSTFVQDEWKATTRLSLSLGLRWDINPAPGNLNGPSPYTVDQITNLAAAQLAPANTPLWKTDWHGFAPRVGLAYQLRQATSHETVLRTGFGIFYDLGSTQGSNGFTQAVGFTSSSIFFGVPLPLTSTQVTLPPPSVASPYNAAVFAFDPNLKLPYTMQWNLALEQGLGANQTLTVTYLGSAGRKLLVQFYYFPADNPNFSQGNGLGITSNAAGSDYNALQAKYQKNLGHGLQALVSYTWSHSIDDASSNFTLFNALLRGSSDFDVRHNFQAAITYDVPGSYGNSFASAVLKQWGFDARISARSALPVDIAAASEINPITGQNQLLHADLVPGIPIYLYGSQYPGGRVINYNAFAPAPMGVDGNIGRNFARGLGAVQADLALRREFPIYDRLHLQFRAEAFNALNHPNFGYIYQFLTYGPNLFGYAHNTLNNSLGGLDPLHQTGGPRSLQLALKLIF